MLEPLDARLGLVTGKGGVARLHPSPRLDREPCDVEALAALIAAARPI